MQVVLSVLVGCGVPDRIFFETTTAATAMPPSNSGGIRYGSGLELFHYSAAKFTVSVCRVNPMGIRRAICGAARSHCNLSPVQGVLHRYAALHHMGPLEDPRWLASRVAHAFEVGRAGQAAWDAVPGIQIFPRARL